MTNYGLVQSLSGTLSFSGTGTHTGNFSAATGSTLTLSGGTYSITSNVLDNGGIVQIGGSADFQATYYPTTISIVGVVYFQPNFVNSISTLSVSGALYTSKSMTVSTLYMGGYFYLSGNVTFNVTNSLTLGNYPSTIDISGSKVKRHIHKKYSDFFLVLYY